MPPDREGDERRATEQQHIQKQLIHGASLARCERQSSPVRLAQSGRTILPAMSNLELQLHEPADDREVELQKAQSEADFKWLMADPRGRRIARRLLEQSGIWRLSYTGDAISTAFHEGERNGGLRLMAGLLQAAPEATARIIAGQDSK
jgi:hypothetical protein